MPSKQELKNEVDELRASLKDTTKRLTKVENVTSVVTKPSGNPNCFSAIKTIESDIAKGKTYWTIAEEQYKRWSEDNPDKCLPCEREYVEAKESLSEVGEQLENTQSESFSSDIIRAQLREQTMREIAKAIAHAKNMAGSCAIKLPEVISHLRSLRVLAHVGKWDTFADSKDKLMGIFESDVRKSIPGIRIGTPSYAVPDERELEQEIKLKPESELTDEEKKFRHELGTVIYPYVGATRR